MLFRSISVLWPGATLNKGLPSKVWSLIKPLRYLKREHCFIIIRHWCVCVHVHACVCVCVCVRLHTRYSCILTQALRNVFEHACLCVYERLESSYTPTCIHTHNIPHSCTAFSDVVTWDPSVMTSPLGLICGPATVSFFPS